MAEKGEYTVSDIYRGGYSSMNPEHVSYATGSFIPAGEIGAPTKPDTANQIANVSQLLNQGIIPIEVGALSPEVFEQIPNEQFKEMNRLAQLTGAQLSVHAPMIEPSGIGEKGGWSLADQKLAERRLTDVFEKSHALDPKGNIPVTIHASNIPGIEYEKVDGEKRIKQLIAVNQETGEFVPLKREEKFYPESEGLTPQTKKGVEYTPEKELIALNNTKWDDAVSSAIFQKDKADQILQTHYPVVKDIYPELIATGTSQENVSKVKELLSGSQRDLITRVQAAQQHLEETSLQARALFNKAWKYSEKDEQRAHLTELSKKYRKDLGIDDSPDEAARNQFDLEKKSRAIQGLLEGLQQTQPDLYVPVEEFAIKKSAETFGNVAFDAFKGNPENSPKVSIENFHPGSAFAYGEEMKKLVESSKEQFIARAKEEGYSENVAQEKADKLIGVTWDVGHINLARKHGFETEDLVKEAEQIAKHVKHVHLTDNFGFSDSHLPPGMGNVPTKEMLELFDKEGFQGRKIVEAGGFVQQFGESPFPYALEGLGAPLYASKQSPYWTEAMSSTGNYYGGMGMFLPQTNYEMFGTSFSSLPQELGGARPGAEGSRMSGRPME